MKHINLFLSTLIFSIGLTSLSSQAAEKDNLSRTPVDKQTERTLINAEYLIHYSEYKSTLSRLENFKVFEDNLPPQMTDKILYDLTRKPELIKLALPYIAENTNRLIVLHSKLQHPLLHELMHQCSHFFHIELNDTPDYLDDKDFTEARNNLFFFLVELRKIAPEFFILWDKNWDTPLQRLIREKRREETTHKDYQKLLELIRPIESEEIDGIQKSLYESGIDRKLLIEKRD